MERIEKTVFISYRRTNIPWALAIFQNLTQHGYDVFFDYNGIASGDFESVILGNITVRAHFLVLLTPSAMERCGDPADWLRREIETALTCQRNIVPLMLEGFDFSTPGIARQLSGTLAVLKHYNGLIIPPEYFLEAMDRLRSRYLNVPLNTVLHPASISAQKAATEQKDAAATAPAVLKHELVVQQWFELGCNATDISEQLCFYNEAIRLKPDFAEALINRGVARMQKDDVEGALQDFNEAIRLKPDDTHAFYNRAKLHSEQGDLDGALEDYKEAIRLNTNQPHANAGVFINQGLVRRNKGDIDGALKDFSEAIRLRPDALAFFNRGAARMDKGDVEGALEDFNQAIRLKPHFAEAFSARGFALSDKGEVESAVQDFNCAIRLKPDFALAFYHRAKLHRDKGDIDGALEDYNQAIRLKPDFADAFYNRGKLRKDKGDVDGALEDYKEAIRLKPDDAAHSATETI